MRTAEEYRAWAYGIAIDPERNTREQQLWHLARDLDYDFPEYPNFRGIVMQEAAGQLRLF